jgi:hypothetical protein
MPFSDISQNDKIVFSDTESYPDCTPVGNAEKVDLFRYPITRMRGWMYSSPFFIAVDLLKTVEV